MPKEYKVTVAAPIRDVPSQRRFPVPVWVLDLLAFPLALVGLLLVLLAWWVPLRISMDGQSTTGIVVDKYVIDGGGEAPDTDNLRYSFVVAARSYSGSAEVGRETYARTVIGDAIAVQFVADDPTINRPSEAPAVSYVQIEGTAVGLTILVMLGAGKWWSVRKAASKKTPDSG